MEVARTCLIFDILITTKAIKMNTLIKDYKFLFATSETDDKRFYLGTDGNYYEKRYGLPLLQATEDWVRSQAWFEANRRGWFTHLVYYNDGDWMPRLSNPEAQQYIVNNLIKFGTKFPPKVAHA